MSNYDVCVCSFAVFFFKQKTAYEMRISDWSSDVCSSDLAEICEDFWAAIPPSSYGALAGAYVCCNLSASNIVIGKARERAMLAAAQSARSVSAYVYSAAGPGESTTDLAWDGQGQIQDRKSTRLNSSH